jgi:uncharacterized membrane protein
MYTIAMTQLLLAFIVSVPLFVALDLLWLGFIARDFYQTRLGHVLADSVNWPAAIVFYLVFLAGVLIFAVMPALEVRSAMKALMLGALFGFFTYATYDLTNLATLRQWPLSLTLVDIVWGTALGATVAAASTAIVLAFMKG